MYFSNLQQFCDLLFSQYLVFDNSNKRSSPVGIYFFKANNGSTRAMSEISSKVIIISHIALKFSMLTLNKEILAGKSSTFQENKLEIFDQLFSRITKDCCY